MSKHKKEVKFGLESLMRLGVFIVLIYIAIGFLSNSKSNLKISNFDTKVLGDYSPKIEQGQRWLETEVVKLKTQAIDQMFIKMKNSILK